MSLTATIHAICEALQDAHSRPPMELTDLGARLSAELKESAVVVALGEREARALVRSSALASEVFERSMGDVMREAEDNAVVLPLHSAVMKIELEMISEQIEQ